MQPQEPTPRKAGRVLVIDPAGRVLLLQGFDPAKPASLHWITIGGGLDHGEGTAQAALRELWEEAGIEASAGELTGPVWQRTTEFSFDGMHYRQEEDYYVLHVGEVNVSLANLDPIERATVTGYRWWSRAELAATTEAFFPAELPELLRLADPQKLAGTRRPSRVRRSAGRPPPSVAQAGAEKDQVGQEHNDANDQQVQQALDYEANDAQGYGRDNQQQEQDHRKGLPF